jgi:hypothetical protein
MRSAVCSLCFLGLSLPVFGELAIDRLALHQYEDGPLLGPNYEFLPGETAYFSCRVSGFQVRVQEEERTAKLTWEMQVEDPSGALLENPLSGQIQESLSSQDKTWIPKFLASFVVPPFAPSGTYKIPVHIRDEIAGKDLRATLEFKVRGHDVEPSETLVARNFKLLHAEDETAVTPPIFKPGSTLWAKFDITGFKLGPQNNFSVEYGLAVENGEGKQLFSQPMAAEDHGEPFYPKRYVPGVLSLNLDSNVSKGQYTLVVILRDQVGQQLQEVRQPFQVE